MDTGASAPIRRVVKLGYDRHVVFTWEGRLIEERPEYLLLAAFFNRGPRDLGYMVLEPGDLFVEWYFFDRWYNVFQIYGQDGAHKGWYCNVGMPPEPVGDDIHYVDLALDVYVYPDGERHLVLDEDEFAVLKEQVLSAQDAAGAEQGLAELLALVADRRLPSRTFEAAVAELAARS